MKLTIPELSLVLLVGPSGCGKSTFARKHFKPTEVVSSDFYRGAVSDDESEHDRAGVVGVHRSPADAGVLEGEDEQSQTEAVCVCLRPADLAPAVRPPVPPFSSNSLSNS